MNLKRIIREEINDFSDSFYLIVSADEKYIYGSVENQSHAGNRFRPIKDYTIKDVVNSKYISYKQAEHPIEWSKFQLKNGVNVTMIELAKSILKYNPKIITMDLILNKRNDNFPMMESNDMEWINDIKSNKDIAEELFNQTVITKDKGIVKLPFSWAHHQSKKPYFDLSIKKKYGKDKDSDDIWKRYKVLVNNRLKELTGKSIKESNDMDWVDESMPTLSDAFYGGLLKVGDIVTLSGQLVDLDHKDGLGTDDFKVKIEKLGSLINSSDFTPLQKEYWGHLGYNDEPLRFAKEDGDMSVVSIE